VVPWKPDSKIINMLPKQDIEARGGKAAILDYLRDKTDLPIPKYDVLGFDDSFDKAAEIFSKLTQPVIVRSSSPHEYGDFEGIFDSVKGVISLTGLEKAVEQVRASATSYDAKQYAEQKGIKLGGRLHAILQEQSSSKYGGAMMRHPNNPETILISYFEGKREDFGGRTNHGGTYDEKRKSMRWKDSDVSDDEARQLIKAYKKIETLTKIAEGEALFVEFGLNPLAIYQVRPFKKFQTADFEVPQIPTEMQEFVVTSDYAFGITPPEGIEVPLLRTFGRLDACTLANEIATGRTPVRFSEQEDHLRSRLRMFAIVAGSSSEPILTYEREINDSMQGFMYQYDKDMNKPYCLVASSARSGEKWDLFTPRATSLIAGDSGSFLVHDMIRLLKKSDVSLLCRWGLPEEFLNGAKSLEKKVRIISNGKEGVALLP